MTPQERRLRFFGWFVFGIILGVMFGSSIAEAQIPGDTACDGENGPPPPYCRRAESCQQYYGRLAATCTDVPPTPFLPSGRLCQYTLWNKWHCTISGGRCDRQTGRKTMRPYFRYHWHGCSCQGQTQVPGIGPGENHPCWAPDPLIFSDDFEDGNLLRWSDIKP